METKKEEGTVEIKESDFKALKETVEKIKEEKNFISGRWVSETTNKNGIILNKNGVTEILFYKDLDRIRNGESEYCKTVLYEQKSKDNEVKNNE